jgi:hypothetical protein
MPSTSQNALDRRARLAARRVGLTARKSRCRKGTIDNYGNFILYTYTRVVGGERFSMTAEEVLAFCRNYKG